MTLLIILISFINIFLFKNNPKKLVFYLLILFPYFGILQFYLMPLTSIYAIFYDFIFCIPIYCGFFFNNKTKQSFELNKISLFIIFYFLFNTVYLFTPGNPYPLFGRLIGFKVTMFYIYFVFIGYYILETKDDFKKIINILSIGSIIPCTFVILQYFIALNYGHSNAFFLVSDLIDPSLITQGLTQFNLGSLKVFRLNGTFSFSTQLANYILFLYVPVITSLYLNNSKKLIILNKFALVLLFISSLLCGSRSMILFVPIILILYMYFKLNYKTFWLSSLFITIITTIFYSFNLLYFDNFFSEYYILFDGYSSNLNKGWIDFIYNNFWGNGLGTATPELRFLFGIDLEVYHMAKRIVNERYYFKILYETGFLGLILFIIFAVKLVSYPMILLKKNITSEYRSFAALTSSFTIFIFFISSLKGFSIDLFPTSFMKYLIIGMTIKIIFLCKKQSKKII